MGPGPWTVLVSSSANLDRGSTWLRSNHNSDYRPPLTSASVERIFENAVAFTNNAPLRLVHTKSGLEHPQKQTCCVEPRCQCPWLWRSQSGRIVPAAGRGRPLAHLFWRSLRSPVSLGTSLGHITPPKYRQDASLSQHPLHAMRMICSVCDIHAPFTAAVPRKTHATWPQTPVEASSHGHDGDGEVKLKIVLPLRFRSAGVESVSSSAADFGSSSGGGATASASAATAAASTASVRGSTARGALHCFWPRYGSSFSAVSSHKVSYFRGPPGCPSGGGSWAFRVVKPVPLVTRHIRSCKLFTH